MTFSGHAFDESSEEDGMEKMLKDQLVITLSRHLEHLLQQKMWGVMMNVYQMIQRSKLGANM